MMRYSLYIGNKNYSSWSMRPWVAMKQVGIDFTEVKLRFDSFADDSIFKRSISVVSPTGKVPLLIDHDQADLAVWDSLAICEYLAEQHPEKNLWPRDIAARSVARSICAQMHSGFTAIRSYLMMNLEARLPEIGQLVLRDQPAVVQELERVIRLWTNLLEQNKGPMLMGDFSIADAFYAPMCSRLLTYQISVPKVIEEYMARIVKLSAVQEWVDDALNEHDFIAFEEPYRLKEN